MRHPHLRYLAPALAALIVAPGFSEDAPVVPATPVPTSVSTTKPEVTAKVATTLEVVGDSQADAAKLPGTATVLDAQLLEQHRYQNVHQTLRLAPGVNAVDEDGYGIRLNVGLRGARAVRSLKTLILEDGIPLAPNPYNDPGLYMGPAYSRFAAVEIVKGSGQIQYGPHTTAGLINFKTRDPSFTAGARADIQLDTFNGYRGLLQGDIPLGEDVALAVDLYALDTDGFRRFDHVTQTEIAPKLVWRVNDLHALELRFSHTAEQSNLTYQGLARDDFEDNPYNRYDFTSRDRFDGERTAVSLRHVWNLEAAGTLRTTGYAQLTDRTWDRAEQLFTGTTYVGQNVTTAGVTRDASARDRRYYQGGLETRWNNTYTIGGMTAEVDAGLRGHVEGQNNATRDHEVVTGNYLTRQVDVRDTLAGAMWAQVALGVGGGLTVVPGARVETIHITSQREITNYVDANQPEGDSSTSEVLPGVGLIYDLTGNVQFYGGVHRGFSPPSYSQAVASDGTDNELDSELSWNYELGSRLTLGSFAYIDLVGFYVDYENIIVQGIAGGPQINGGEATHYGAELLTEVDVIAGNAGALRVPFRLAATWLQAEYDSDVFSGATLVGEEGNDIEYAPNLTLSASIGIDRFGPREAFGVFVTATYIGEQYSDGLNTEAVDASGSIGLIDDVLLFDVTARYKPAGKKYEIYVGVENLLDEEYAAYRRGGQGTVSGAPLKAVTGIAASF